MSMGWRSLSGTLAALTATLLLLSAAANPARAEIPLWRAYMEVAGQAGDSRNIGEAQLFLPLYQNECTLIFGDLRGNVTDQDTYEGNAGLAFRRLLADDQIIFGVYGFYDWRKTQFSNNFQQATIGAELLSYVWDLRINGYFPDMATKNAFSASTAEILNGTLVVRAGQELALPGADIEMGALLARHKGSNWDMELRVFAGAFCFDREVAKAFYGEKARVELRLYDLPILGDDSRLVFAGEYQYDNFNQSTAAGIVSVRIPFGRRHREHRLTPMQRRMVDRIVRDVDIRTTVGATGAPESAINPLTGQVITSAQVVDATNGNVPATVAGAGTNSVVVLDGSKGNIVSGATINVQSNQVLMGGGSTFTVVGANSGASATFTAPGTRPTVTTNVAITSVVTLNGSSKSTVTGLDILSTAGANSPGLQTTGGSNNNRFSELNVTTTQINGDGILLAETNSVFTNININTTGIASEGLVNFGGGGNTFSNMTITTSGIGGSLPQSASAIHNLAGTSNNTFTKITLRTSGNAFAFPIQEENTGGTPNNNVFRQITILGSGLDAINLNGSNNFQIFNSIVSNIPNASFIINATNATNLGGNSNSTTHGGTFYNNGGGNSGALTFSVNGISTTIP